MKTEPAVLVTNNNVTLVIDGEVFTGSREYAEQSGVLVALNKKDFARAAELLNKAKAITRRSLGAFELEGETIMFRGIPVHNVVATRIVQFVESGLPFMPAVRFLENLLENPSKRAVDEGYAFLEHKNLPLTEDGCFLAYKSVRSDYLDKYSGTIDNSVGKVVEVPRNMVDDNREHECSAGLHVGSLEYAGPSGWYNRPNDNVVIVKVNPRDIVSVPRDHSAQKMRVCRYEVIADFVAKYEAPLTASNGESFKGSSEPEVDCYDCGWVGAYSQLDRGRECPDCGSEDLEPIR
jgi:hypothetical protein